jgi:hypothetical protein
MMCFVEQIIKILPIKKLLVLKELEMVDSAKLRRLA